MMVTHRSGHPDSRGWLRVRCTLPPKLVNKLIEAADEKEVSAMVLKSRELRPRGQTE
jgi:hypothetical protein